jgi:S1-C subfamily serine protease
MRILLACCGFILALCLLTFDFVLSAPIEGKSPTEASPTPAVVQLLAIGPGRGDQNQACAATGFFVNEQGYILTNAHVVEDARRCLAGSPEGRIVAKLAEPDQHAATAVSCEVVALDEENDLALLKTQRPPPEGKNYPFARLSENGVSAGAEVRVLGHPQFSWQAKQLSGRVVRVVRPAHDEGGPETLVFNVRLEVGSSGSPVFLPSGEVAGVVVGRDTQNASYSVAIAIRHAIALLKSHGVPWHGE